ncbi:hypothetical protein BO78DRAFT_422273 [Aspergillus sclerotiicarbonarius CBS 121057]|uniref:Tat pathway signal sequence n=1 Tax=Aspergillus sclerotiicarbonarius (strain CBS 121057 / IBT 28362) TaxID=1448318 RepID=A0A319EPL6_ASPSB|nr:hypothetical protein BO78DRAFT_422273 [Aspergillus sclerotiicarbonarius CBS 121057]
MFLTSKNEEQGKYEPLAPLPDTEQHNGHTAHQTRPTRLWFILTVTLALFASFMAGASTTYLAMRNRNHQPGLDSVAPRIPIPSIAREFVPSSNFSNEPPQSGDIPEPIWDSLIPNGLGYFQDTSLVTQPSIPTVFHQLHCLYILRRAYYALSDDDDDDLQRFDFGKNRSIHVPHCFDYLRQGITCSADTTVEPAVDEENGFLGSGFPRQCVDFDALKEYVEERRIFNASGFLAVGYHHDHH